MTDHCDLGVHRARFLAFTEEFSDVPDAAPLRLKVEHSFRVFEHAGRIVKSLDKEMSVPKNLRRDVDCRKAALLSSLYHDCGRFPQFKEYRTFLDAVSVDHAVLSFRVARERAFLREEKPEVRQLALCAILLHNRYRLPSMLDPRARFVVDIVRDADKLDILRIMVEHLTAALPEKDAVLLHVKDEPDRWSPNIVQDVMEGRVARYADLRYVNDFRLLLGTWMRELRFSVTRSALAESGLMDAVLAQLPDAEALAPALAVLRRQLEACRKGEEVC